MDKEKIFEYYCLDKTKPITEELNITYSEDGLIRKFYFKTGLRALIKKIDCYILYTSTEEDFENLLFIPVDYFYDHFQRLSMSIIPKYEYLETIKQLQSINIFEFTSLLDFMYIFEEFKNLILTNWQRLNMNSLIEF